MTTLFACLFVVCVAGRAALAQPPPTAFEVATVKLLPPLPVGTPLPTIILALYRNGSLTMSNVTLSEALRFAYDLTTDDQVSGPDWITSRGTRYEVVAKTAGDVTPVQASGGSKLADGTHIGSSTMSQFALLLSTFERQMILDRAGLTGRYQINVEYLTEAPGAAPDETKPSLQSALQDQLGLRLEARREPLDAIVVERAAPMPIEN